MFFIDRIISISKKKTPQKSQPSYQQREPTKSKSRIHEHPEVKVQRIIDGDTVVVIHNRQKVKIRLDAIDCPEDGQEWGDIATYGLIKLIGGKTVRLEVHTVDIYKRTVATLYVQQKQEWININEKMVTLGHAWVMRRYYKHLPKERQEKLNTLERWAKSREVGLWKSPNPIPPWKWRGEVKNGSF